MSVPFARDQNELDDPILALTLINATTTAPTTVADGYACVDNTQLMGARYVNVQGRITGTSAAAMRGYVYWWSTAAARWFQNGGLTFHTDAEILGDATGVKSNNHLVRRPPNCSRMMVHFAAGPGADNVMNLEIVKDT
jgi:hypothetical protein